MSFCYRTLCLCSIMGVKIKITSQKEKRIAFTIRSLYKIKLINYQYARKPITP